MFTPKVFIELFQKISACDQKEQWSYKAVSIDDYLFVLAQIKLSFSGDELTQTFVFKITNTHINVELDRDVYSFEIGDKTESGLVIDILNHGFLFKSFNELYDHSIGTKDHLSIKILRELTKIISES